MSNKNITALIENSIPEFIRIEYPNFVEFIKVYYSQQEVEGSGYEFIANLSDYMDVDRTSLEFLNNFSKQYLSGLPNNIISSINKRTLIKYIREFYQSAGSESSFKFLFRIMFNEDIDIYYPSKDMLRVSHGKWQNDVVIKVTNTELDDHIINIEGTEITGETSGARAIVDKVKLYTSSNGISVAELFIVEIDPINGIHKFKVDEYIRGIDMSRYDSGHAFHEKILSIMTGVNLISPGQYYVPGDIIDAISTVGADAFIIVDQVHEGNIESIDIIKGGIDYVVGDLITFSSTSGKSAKARVNAIDGVGAITDINIINSGYGYKEMPVIDINSIAGTGAALYVVSSEIGKIKKTKMISHGVNYTLNPSGSFPYTFPISFSASYEQGVLSFYKIFFAYNDNWNTTEYNTNEIILGETSGARALLNRVNRESGVFAYTLINEIDFIIDENIIGETSGATGYKVHVKFEGTGTIQSGAVGTYDGYYANTDGFLDSDKYIQDSYYYQVFSYVLNTLRPRDEWIDAIKASVHPAGTIVFGFGDKVAILGEPSEGGWIGPLINTIEFYKFRWGMSLYDLSEYTSYGNTQMSILTDHVIGDVMYYDPILYSPEAYPGVNDYVRTSICFGSEIQFQYVVPEGQEFTTLIDELNSLLIDAENNSLLI